MSRGFAMIPCLLLGMVVGLGVALVVLIAVKRRGKYVADPACRKCGYAVRGLPTFTCPECGSDLREVGIVTPGQGGLSPKSYGILMVLLWTLVLPVPAAILTMVVAQATPQVTETHSRYGAGSPVSGAYQRIDLDQKITEKGNHVISNRVTYTLIPSQGKPIQIEIDPVGLGYRYQEKSGKEAKADTGLDESTFLDWMSQAGVDREDKQVRRETAELMAFARGAALGTVDSLSAQHFRSVGTSQSSYTGPARWALVTAGAFWLAVWLLGCWRLWRIATQKRG